MIKIIENNDYGIPQIQVVMQNDFTNEITKFGQSGFVHSNIDDAIDFFEWIVKGLHKIKEEEQE